MSTSAAVPSKTQRRALVHDARIRLITDFAGAARRAVLQPLKDATAARSREARLRSGFAARIRSVNSGSSSRSSRPEIRDRRCTSIRRFDEAFYVLEGTLAFRLGDHTRDAGSGSAAFVPRGTAHTFANPGDQARADPDPRNSGWLRALFRRTDRLDQCGRRRPAAEKLAALRIAHGSIPA